MVMVVVVGVAAPSHPLLWRTLLWCRVRVVWMAAMAPCVWRWSRGCGTVCRDCPLGPASDWCTTTSTWFVMVTRMHVCRALADCVGSKVKEWALLLFARVCVAVVRVSLLLSGFLL